MVVQFGKWFEIGSLKIPPGEYWVTARSDTMAINLAGGGCDFPVPATRRQARRNFRVSAVQFHSLDGKNWSLLVRVPPNEEWSALLRVSLGPSSRSRD